jgi:hypothetical protein
MLGVNLIPAERRSALQRRGRLRRWGAAMIAYGGLVMAACVGARITWAPGDGASAEDLTQLQARNTQLNGMIAQSRKQTLEAHTEIKTAQSITDQPDWNIVLTLLGQTVGEEIVLKQIQLRPEQGAAKSYSLVVRGVAMTQTGASKFIARLEGLQLFDQVKLVRTGRETVLDTPAVSFELACFISEDGRPRP